MLDLKKKCMNKGKKTFSTFFLLKYFHIQHNYFNHEVTRLVTYKGIEKYPFPESFNCPSFYTPHIKPFLYIYNNSLYK